MSGNITSRTNWTRSLTIVTLIAIAGAVIGCLASGRPVETNRFYLTSSAGPVLFDHGTHADDADSCAVCHHDLYSAALATDCAECHDDGYEPDDVSHTRLKEIHSQDCTTCHEQAAGDEQATSCRACHTSGSQSDALPDSCNRCHDDDITADLLEHDEYLEIEEHSCLSCHSPSSASETYHTSCTSCHLENGPDRFSAADGGVACGACHLL